MRISRDESLDLIVCVFKSLTEIREEFKKTKELIGGSTIREGIEKHIKRLEKLEHKLATDEWDVDEEAIRGDRITYLNSSNCEVIYDLILKHFIAEASAQEIWEDICYVFPDISPYDRDDLTNEIVNLNFDNFVVEQGNRFKKIYNEYMLEMNE